MSQPSSTGAKGSIGLVAAAAMGVGGMMGAGLYTLVGLATTSAGTALPVAFLVAGAAASFSVYSYARLGATYPSRGGAAQFLVEEFGEGVVSGGLNVFQYLSYLIATSLYAAGFAEYVTAVAGDALPSWAGKVVGVAVVVLFTAVNLVGTRFVGRAETVIVGVEVAILAALVILGVVHADPSLLESGESGGFGGVITAAALLYVTYQGFGVVANAAGGMRRPSSELPRAMFLALGVVATVYLLVSAVVVLVLPVAEIVPDAGHVLADVGQALLGRAGFLIVAAAAILATASAVNATLFASTNVGYTVAEKDQLSKALTRTVWRNTPAALVAAAAVVIGLVLIFPLDAVGQLTSMAFLVVYGAVSAGHLRLRSRTRARAWPLVTAVVLNTVLFVALLVDTITRGEWLTWLALVVSLVGSFAFEAAHRRRPSVARS